jgi:hypothetical protein
MKERSILFNGPMVAAILSGGKTQTRRAVKSRFELDYLPLDDEGPIWPHLVPYSEMLEEEPMDCAYGQPGDRLWVRETWRAFNDGSLYEENCLQVDYRATPASWAKDSKLPWKPSIHMPRWASRILLEIVSVRVERLQDISDQDAIAEGIGLNASAAGVPMTTPVGETMPRAMYRDLWESINGAGSWDANPWVWKVEFRRIEA